METKAKFLTTKQMTLIALMTALTCILGPLSIPLPFSPVPISFTNGKSGRSYGRISGRICVFDSDRRIFCGAF